jgi:hypothetical protein
MKKVELGKTYLGVVEDNKDPQKLGRLRIRVMDIYEELPKEDLPWASPWKDLNGNEFNIPDIGKVLIVVFEHADVYKPEFIFSDHFNINLENKIKTLSESDYLSMKSLLFDHRTQIYVNESEGLKIDHKYNNINIKENSINLNLKDNNRSLNLGDETANQQVILGNNFFQWFDEFITALMLPGASTHIAGIPNPAFIQTCMKYQALKTTQFLSHHVNCVNNNLITTVKTTQRQDDPQLGDGWTSTKEENTLTTKTTENFTPVPGDKPTYDDTYKAPPVEQGVPDNTDTSALAGGNVPGASDVAGVSNPAENLPTGTGDPTGGNLSAPGGQLPTGTTPEGSLSPTGELPGTGQLPGGTTIPNELPGTGQLPSTTGLPSGLPGNSQLPTGTGLPTGIPNTGQLPTGTGLPGDVSGIGGQIPTGPLSGDLPKGLPNFAQNIGSGLPAGLSGLPGGLDTSALGGLIGGGFAFGQGAKLDPNQFIIPAKPGLNSTKSNPKLDRLVGFLNFKNYVLYQEEYVLNIVAIRNVGEEVTNTFDDDLYVFFKNDKQEWEIYEYKITTVPGLMPGTENLPNNVAIMRLGQYVDQLKLGLWRDEPNHKCLKFENAAVQRNTNNKKYDYESPTEIGNFPLAIHRSSPTSSAEYVFNYSEGTQVFKSITQFEQFIRLCERQINDGDRELFTYTLCSKTDFDKNSKLPNDIVKLNKAEKFL